MRKAAPVDRSLEKAPLSPAGSCSALVLLVQCCRRSCPHPLLPHPAFLPPPSPTYVPPGCPPCAGALLTAWTPDLGIWRPERKACSQCAAQLGPSWSRRASEQQASCEHRPLLLLCSRGAELPVDPTNNRFVKVRNTVSAANTCHRPRVPLQDLSLMLSPAVDPFYGLRSQVPRKSFRLN